MQQDKTVYEYILTQEADYKTARIPITGSKDWNMHEHIERCTNVSNAWFHKGQNDGLRPYNDIVTPILNVARRSEGFDVKDIVPYVNKDDSYYKSFLVKKYHPQWARKYELDSFIDEMVDSSIVYDLVLVKNVNGVRPEVIPLQTIAFCDQTDILSGPIALKHQYSISDLLEFKGKWDNDKIDEAIVMAKASKTVSQANDQEVKTPGKYIEVYELHGTCPTIWLKDGAYMEDEYCDQIHIVTFYTDSTGKKNGITLFSGKEKKSAFKALVINKVFGRACGKSIVESLFEDQVWTNYSGIRIKELLDATAIVLFQTDDSELANQKISNLKNNTVIKHEQGRPITKLDTTVPNITAFTNHQIKLENNARVLGSASDAQLGTNPVSGTPFALQNLVVQQGQGIHEFRQGKIASFMADQLYRDWILGYLVKEMNEGKDFSEELTLDEIEEISEKISSNYIDSKLKRMILESGNVPTRQEADIMKQVFKDDWKKKGSRRFFKILAGELNEIPLDVFVNINQKQKDMSKNADTITNLIREIIRNPAVFAQLPGLAKPYNELLENAGVSPIDFTNIITPNTEQIKSPLAPVAGQEEVLPA